MANESRRNFRDGLEINLRVQRLVAPEGMQLSANNFSNILDASLSYIMTPSWCCLRKSPRLSRVICNDYEFNSTRATPFLVSIQRLPSLDGLRAISITGLLLADESA